jgi:hypothetical protein
MAQVAVIAAKIYSQHAQMTTVIRTVNRGRNSAALFGPLPDDLVVGRGEAAALAFGFILGGGDLLRTLQRVG